MHSLGIGQWNSTRRDHPGNSGRVSGSGPVTRGPNCKTFHFSHAPVLTVGSTAELLVGCLGSQFVRHW